MSEITLDVCRIDPGDRSERALTLHNLRRDALHAVFDGETSVKVINWGKTDDSGPHEYVAVTIALLAGPLIKKYGLALLQELGKKLAEKAVDEATSGLIKKAVQLLVPAQKEKRIGEVCLHLAGGKWLKLTPPDNDEKVTISFADGDKISVAYEAKDKSQ